MQKKEYGNWGEELTAIKLEKEGFIIKARNFKKSYAEIDIIAQKDDLFIFVEVKSRTSCDIDPAELISKGQQRRIITAAQSFLACYNYDAYSYRFDVSLVTVLDSTPIITYIPDAFTTID